MSLHLANISMEEGGRRGINFLTRRINFNVNAESFHLIGTSRRETIKSGESFPLPLLRRVINEAMNRQTMPVTRRSASEYRIGNIDRRWKGKERKEGERGRFFASKRGTLANAKMRNLIE